MFKSTKNVFSNREERRDASKLYNPMRVSELTSLDPTTPWLEYINTILTTDIVQVPKPVATFSTFQQVSGAEIIIVDVPNYITNFSQLIQNTPKRVQVKNQMVCDNYIYITIPGQLPDVAGSGCKHGLHERGTKSTILNLIFSPGQAADKISLKFSKKLTGKSEEPPRWRKCVGAASGLNFLQPGKL